MTKQKKKPGGTARTSGSTTNPGSNFSTLPIVVFVVGAGVLIWLIMGSFNSPTPAGGNPPATATDGVDDSEQQPSPESGRDIVAEKTEGPEPLSDADRQKLLGKWERQDNPPYTIELRLVKPDGMTDARYFNPRPINVAEAFTVAKDGKLALFMKMQDVGYDGSTYTLVYDQGQDLLIGEYFQATQRQTYEVAFQRKTE
jgi:hypothetical protein